MYVSFYLLYTFNKLITYCVHRTSSQSAVVAAPRTTSSSRLTSRSPAIQLCPAIPRRALVVVVSLAGRTSKRFLPTRRLCTSSTTRRTPSVRSTVKIQNQISSQAKTPTNSRRSSRPMSAYLRPASTLTA